MHQLVLPHCVVTRAGHHETFYCCGYAIDLLMRLANQSHFQYDVHLVEDGLHGTLEPVSSLGNLIFVS